MKKQPLITILGPTATGKSDLAVILAKKFAGEIISADSRQVYKELNLLSGKITKGEMQKIPHYLLGVTNLKKDFSVSDFQKQAEKALKKIRDKNKVPFLVGGTGMYINSIVYNQQFPEVGPNLKLRAKLEKLSLDELQRLLKKKDPDRFETVDIKNKRRIIRALEIIEAIGKVPKKDKNKKPESLLVGIDWPDNILKEKIFNRIKNRIQEGMLDEAKEILDSGISKNKMLSLGLECKYAIRFLEKAITKEQFVEELNTAIWQYVKRQRTWFKKDPNIKWFRPDQVDEIEKVIEEYLIS